MDLFSKKHPKDADNEEELEQLAITKLDKLGQEIREKEIELGKVHASIRSVKDEYDAIVSNLMAVKKELNQKKTDLKVIKNEHTNMITKIKDSQRLESDERDEFVKTTGRLKEIKEEIESITKLRDKNNAELEREEAALRLVIKQRITANEELEEINAKLHSAKEDIDKQGLSQNNIQDDISDIQNQTKSGIIEAASIVASSLKAKLYAKQRELEAVQLLLEKEREEHERDKIS